MTEQPKQLYGLELTNSQRLEVAEIEGDLLKAVASKNFPKVAALYEKLLKARRQLSDAEIEMP